MSFTDKDVADEKVMSFSDEDVQLAVKRGAYWLDETHPSWAEKIDLSGLVMQNCEHCVIGQAVGDYYETVAAGYATESSVLRVASEDQDDWAITHGFQSPNYYRSGRALPGATTDRYYAKLEEIWTDEVRKRLG